MFGAEMKIQGNTVELVITRQARRRHNRNITNVTTRVMIVVLSSACNKIYNNSTELNCAILFCQPLTNMK